MTEYKSSFEMLGIELTSEEHIFRDDGFVSDMKEHSEKLEREFPDAMSVLFGDPFVDTSQASYWVGLIGEAQQYDVGRPPITNVVWYTDLGSQEGNVVSRGRGETHTLSNMGQLGLLEAKLRDANVNIGLQDPSLDSDFVAAIGGLYAADRQSLIDIATIPAESMNEDFQLALERYKEALS